MDQFYYESGYVDASYFVYTAEAESLEAGSFTLTASVGVIREAAADLTATSEIQATISHIEGADLFAFTEAALAAQVDRIRDNNIEITSAFTQVTAGSKFIHFSSDQNIETSITADNLRVRFSEAAVDAAFSLAASGDITPAGATIEANGAWTTEFVVDAKISRKQNIIDCDVLVESTQTTTGQRVAGLVSDFEVVTFVSASTIDRIRSADSSLSAEFTQTADVNETVQLAADLTAQASVTATISHIEGADLQAFTQTSLAATGLRIKSLEASVASTSALSATGNLENERPWQFTNYGSPVYTSTAKVLGTGNLYLATTSDYLRSTSLRPEFSFGTDDFIIEFFTRANNNGTILSYGTYNTTLNGGWEIRRQTSGSNIGFQFLRDNGNNTGVTHSGLSGFTSADNWYIRVVRSGTSLSMTVRRLSAGTWSSEVSIFSATIVTDPIGGSVGEPGGTNYLRIGGGTSSGFVGYIDELYIAKGTTTSQQFISGAPALNTQGKETTTLLLMHLDSSSLDDITGTLNATAALTAQASFTAQADNRVKTATASLQVQGFVVSASGRIRPEVAALDSQFVVTTNAGILLATSAGLSASTTLTASVLDLDLGQASLSAQFAISATAKRLRGISSAMTSTSSISCSVTHYKALDYGLVRSLLHFNSSTVDSVDPSGVTSVSPSYVTSVSSNFSTEIIDPNVSVYRPTGEHSTSVWGDDFAFDLRVRPRFPAGGISGPAYNWQLVTLKDNASSGTNEGWQLRFVFLDPTGTNIAFQLLHDGTLYLSDNTPLATGGLTNSITNNTFHVAVQKYNTTVELWVNGQLYETQTSPSINNIACVGPVVIGNAGGAGDGAGRIDEFRLIVGATPYTSTFTPPTLEYVPAENGYTFMSASTSMSTIGLRVKAASSAFTSAFNSQITGNRLRGITQSSQSTSQLTATAIKVSTGQVTAQSQATLTAPVIKTAQAAGALVTSADLTAQAVKYRPAASAVLVQANLSTNAVKTTSANASLTVQTSLACQALRIKQIASNFSAIATELAAVVKIGQGFIHADIVATLAAPAVKTTSTALDATITSQLTANAISTSQATADLSTQAALTLVPTYLRRNESVMQVTAGQTTNAVKTTSADISLTSQASTSTDSTNSKITGYSANLAATTSLSTNNQIVRLATANLTADTQVLATVYSLVQMQASLQVQGFVLTAGRVLHIDEFNQLKIRGETRYQVIRQETRGLVIKGETRVNKIKGYSL